MIFDSLANCEQYYNLKGLRYLKSLADGRYEIDGDRLFANVQSLKTKPKEDKKWEVHRKYIDIQYVINGFECMGFGLLDDFKTVKEAYNEAKDVEFLDGEKYSFINVEEGNFTVFYPNDVHAPMLSVEKTSEIKKVIVKIAI